MNAVVTPAPKVAAKKAASQKASLPAAKAPATTKTARAPAKPAAKPATRPAPQAAAKSAKASKPAKAAKPVAAAAAAPASNGKQKLVRDSFTMPSHDFCLIHTLKERSLGFRRPTKKSELLRAGLHALTALGDTQLRAVLDGLTPLKSGRPKKAG